MTDPTTNQRVWIFFLDERAMAYGADNLTQ